MTERDRERVTRVVEMSLSGHTQAAIAERLGITQPRVSQILSQARDDWARQANTAWEQHVAQALARIELLWTKVSDRMDASEDATGVVDDATLNQAMRLEERRARLLGLDFSDKVAEARLRLDAKRLEMMADVLTRAFDAAELDEHQRQTMLRVVAAETEPGTEPGGGGSGSDSVRAIG